MCISRMKAFFLLVMLVFLFVGGCTKRVPIEKVEVVPWEQLDQDGDGITNGEDLCPCTPGQTVYVTREGCWNPFKYGYPNFDFEKSFLSTDDEAALRETLHVFFANPEMVVEIWGTTDVIGSDSYNYPLSQRRAEEVKAFLIRNGVPEYQVIAVGKGSELSDPMVITPADGEKDRRVFFSVRCSDSKLYQSLKRKRRGI